MKRVVLHIFFWLAYLIQDVFLIFLLNTTRLQQPAATNLQLSVSNGLVLLLPKLLFTYFCLYVTLPTVIKDGLEKRGACYTLLALVATVVLYQGLVIFLINPIIYGWERPADSFFYPLAFLVAVMDIGFVSGAAVGIKQIRQQLRREKAQQSLVKEKLEAELKYLRHQTHPHFLFNTLNNIYALAKKKSDETAGVVLKLSKLLRFMLYDTAQPLIPLEDEIRMLEHYMDLEKIRYNDKLSISFLKDISDERESIAPLLLLPFVENAFKHGASESRFASYIHVQMTLQNGILKFSVKNTKETNQPACDGPTTTTIGLTNVKRQLELLYTEYDIQVLNESSVFIVFLTINLKTYAKNTLSHC